MTTPEGKVKDKIRKIIKRYPDIYSYWPVPAGYGPSSLDCILCVCGVFISIEAKAPGKEPSPRQEMTIADMNRAGGITLVIDGRPEQLADLITLLDSINHASRSRKSET